MAKKTFLKTMACASHRYQHVRLLSKSNFDDIDQYLNHITAISDSHLVQLDKGPFTLSEQFIVLGEFSVLSLYTNRKLFEYYSLPPGHVLIAFSQPYAQPGYQWCGMNVEPNRAGFMHPGREYSGVSAAGLQMVNIVLPESWMIEQLEGYREACLQTQMPEQAVFPLPNARSVRLRNVLNSLFRDQHLLHWLEQDQEVRNMFEEWIQEEVLQLTRACLGIGFVRAPLPAKSDYLLLRDAVALIENQLNLKLSTSELASQLQITPRMLQYTFRKHLDMTPLQYIRHRKLLGARDMLNIGSSERGCTISEVATRVGIDHLGRFSINYKRLFGESPSETQRKMLVKTWVAPAPEEPTNVFHRKIF